MPLGGFGRLGNLFHHESHHENHHHWNPFHHGHKAADTVTPDSDTQNSSPTNGKRSLGDLKEREWDFELQERGYYDLDELD